MGPSYGAHKAAVDMMAFDMGVDFPDAGAHVAVASIRMGALTSGAASAQHAARTVKM